MTAQDLADRLEKAIDEARAHQPNALIALGMLAHDNRHEILASLRRSAPEAMADEIESIAFSRGRDAGRIAGFEEARDSVAKCFGESADCDGEELGNALDLLDRRLITLRRSAPASGEMVTALNREEQYLIRQCGSEADIMPGDIEGAFHRIREALRTPSGETGEEAGS